MIEYGRYTVYMHENKINRKKYVGCTIQNPEHRWANGKGYSNKFFNEDIIKYGWDNFEHIILETGLCREDAMKKEEFYIQKYNTTNPKYGYNIWKVSNTPSNKTRKKMSDAQLGEKNHMFGKHNSLEAKRKISKANKNPSAEIKSKISEASKRNVTGRIYVNDGINNKMIKPEQLDEYLSNGFTRGRLVTLKISEETKQKISKKQTGKHHSKETKEKMSNAHKGMFKDRIYVNNGSIIKFIKPEQLDEYLKQGYVVGRSLKGSD